MVSVGQESGGRLAGWLWLRASYKVADKITPESFTGSEESAFKIAYSPGRWQETSVPHHVGFSMG